MHNFPLQCNYTFLLLRLPSVTESEVTVVPGVSKVAAAVEKVMVDVEVICVNEDGMHYVVQMR